MEFVSVRGKIEIHLVELGYYVKERSKYNRFFSPFFIMRNLKILFSGKFNALFNLVRLFRNNEFAGHFLNF